MGGWVPGCGGSRRGGRQGAVGPCSARVRGGRGPAGGGVAHLELAEGEDLLPRELHLGGARRGRGQGRA